MPTERLVHIVDEIPELAGVADLTMILVLDGFLDAGNAAARAARHLEDLDTGHGPGPVVATFDVDQLHDYRARRPPMSFIRDHYEAYDPPRLVVRLLHDTGGTPYLLLHGPEPDNRWEAFARSVREVVERLNVTRVIAMGSVPMAVPHTRPLTLTPHANRPELVQGSSPWHGELRIPSSAQSLLELRLGEWGHPMLGFVAHIPHYLAQLDYPKASVVLLEQVELAGRLTIDLSELQALARERDEEIERYLADNKDVADVVAALEQQYDAFERAETFGQGLLASDEPLPTGEEIGQQFERFLAGLEALEGDGNDDLGSDEFGGSGPSGLDDPDDPRYGE